LPTLEPVGIGYQEEVMVEGIEFEEEKNEMRIDKCVGSIKREGDNGRSLIFCYLIILLTFY